MTKKTQEDASFYTGVVHDSYKRAIGAHFKGTHSDWENVLKEQDMILIKAINQKSSLPLERKKYFIALGAWNEVFSHKTADQIFRESYKQGKSLGFKGGIHSWAIGLKSKDKNSAGTAWPVVYNFIDLQTWDALYAPSKYNLGLNYKGKSKLQMFTIRRKNNREYEYKSYESPLSLMINSSNGNITYDSVDNENEKFIVYQKPNGDFTHETIRTSEYEKNLVLAEIKKILEEQGAEAVSEYINKNYKPLFN